jgi:hypothetical protein
MDPVTSRLLESFPWIADAQRVESLRMQICHVWPDMGCPADADPGVWWWTETTSALALPHYDQVVAHFREMQAAHQHEADDVWPWGFRFGAQIFLYGGDHEVSLMCRDFWSDVLEFFQGLATGEPGEVYNGLDQCWQLIVIRLPHDFAIREYDWDHPTNYDRKLIVPCDALLSQIGLLRHGTAEFLDRLERDLGVPCENPDDFDFYTEPGAKAMMAKHIWPEGM